MKAIFAIAVGMLFAAAARLIVERDLLRVAAGVSLLSTSGTVLLMFVGLSRGQAPILPLRPGSVPSDPIVQALALTSVVIGFGLTVLVLALAHRVWATQRSLDQRKLAADERREERGPAVAGDPT